MQRHIDSLKQTILDRLEEIQTLSKALICHSHDVPAYIDCPLYLQRARARPSTGVWSTYAASSWESATS